MKKGGLQQALFEKFMVNSVIVISLILLVFGVILIKIMDNYARSQQLDKLGNLELAIKNTNQQVQNLSQIIAAHWLKVPQEKVFTEQDTESLVNLNGALVGSYVLDADRKVLFATDRLSVMVGKELRPSDYTRSRSPYVSPYSGQIVYTRSVPYATKQDKYVLVSVISMGKIIEAVDKDKATKYILLDKTGRAMVFTSGQDPKQKQMNLLEVLPVFKHTTPESGRSYWYKDPQTKQLVIGTVKGVSGAEYQLLVQQPLLQSFKPAAQLIFFLVLIAFFAIMIASALSERVAEKFWSALDELVIGTTQIAAGNYQALALKNPAYDELELVQQSFINMAKNIQDRQLELQKINEQVQAANAELMRAFTTISEKEAENKAYQVGLISVLVDLIELNDSYTGGHSRQVTYWALLLAKGMIKRGYKISMEEIEIAAILHDIGKIGVPTHILKKPGRLNDEEFEIIKMHPVTGAQAIDKVKKLNNVKGIVRHHHERFDGNGYPDRLIAEEIPLGARIVGIADAFHAMISDRTYRRALAIDEALAELERNAGTQFDPELVEIFLQEYKQSA